MAIKYVEFKQPVALLGASVRVYLKERANDQAAFYFKVEAHGEDFIAGIDSEGIPLRIFLKDIDFIIGG